MEQHIEDNKKDEYELWYKQNMTMNLIDTLITISHVLIKQNLDTPVIQEYLLQHLYRDSAIRSIFSKNWRTK